jgi:hypothetical protein
MRGRKANYSNIDPKISSLYKKGWSFNRIAKKLKIHPEIVKRRCKAMGIETRNLSQAMSLYHKSQRKKRNAKKEKIKSQRRD